MTALVAGTVERTFSESAAIKNWTVAPGAEPARRQDLDDLGESLGRRHQVGTEGIHGESDRTAGSVC